eukprot:1687873-Ditylum_brightwellii.AAC.1
MEKKAIKGKMMSHPRHSSPKDNPMALLIQVQMRKREDDMNIQEHWLSLACLEMEKQNKSREGKEAKQDCHHFSMMMIV